MPAIAIPGPEGRIEARFSPPPRPRAPVAMILHPHPQAGGTMNDRITQAMYKTFVARGFATIRFNFRGVGRSEGEFDNGIGCRPSIPKPARPGLQASALVRGSACSS